MASFFFLAPRPYPTQSKPKCCGLYLPPGMRIACQHFISLFVTACLVDIGYGWTHHRASFTGPKTGATLTSRCRSSCRPSTTSLGPTSLEQQPEAPTEDDGQRVLAVVAPLKYTGQSNYPTLNLQFPELDQVMDDGSVQGVSLDFVMDTGANVNTVEGMVVDSYSLPVAISAQELGAAGAAGMGGSFPACDIHTLGTCKLGGMPPGSDFDFMYGLTAARMPDSLPYRVANGLLGLTFFLSFPAGVELDWYGTDGDPPTCIFYYGDATPPDALKNMVGVPLERLPVQIMSLVIEVNGVPVKAILDTGSPNTILTPEAAYRCGIEVYSDNMAPDDLPLRQQVVGATAMGIDGNVFNLARSVNDVGVTAGGASLGATPIFVGNLPGLEILNQFGMEYPPEAILGLDFLQRAYRIIVKIGDESSLWIEELADQPRWDGQRGYNEGA